MFGYGGRILHIDLAHKRYTRELLDASLARDYVGGRGFVARLLWDNVKRGADPLGPDNVVVIAAGPLTGTFLPSSSKVQFGSKSPLTGGYGDSNMGGHFGAELKHAGYDAVVIQGVSSGPVAIVIDDDHVEFRDGGELWGLGSLDCEERLKNLLGEEFEVAAIGPAGENLVSFACVTHDFGRQAGRTGIGAVLGSKKVKAIAVRGRRGFPVADPEGMLRKGKEMYREVFSLPGFVNWTPYGTADITDWVNETGSFPTRNFSTGHFEGYKQINGKALRDHVLLDKGCFCCPIPCGKVVRTRGVLVEGPEYETIALVGGNCELERIEEIAYVNHVMDQLGLDTISAGNVIGFALECCEKGIIPRSEVGGRDLRFGDVESVLYLAEAIARRRGIGDLLARGVKKAGAELGKQAEELAVHVKGMEVSGYDCRYAAAMLLAYMTCDVGAHHNRAWAITYDVAVGREKTEGKATKVIELQHVRPLLDCLGVCRFPWIELGFDLKHYAEAYRIVTGRAETWEDLLRASERIWNLTRCFWVREVPGFGVDYDQPPAKLYAVPAGSGPTEGKLLGLGTMQGLLGEYYRLRGWTEAGIPTRKKLEEMGLSDVAESLGLPGRDPVE